MLAAHDQENLRHGQQTAAAAKSVNQHGKSLVGKTPGHKAPKTPFKLPLNDENAPLGQGGKSAVKPVGNSVLGTKKGGVVDRSTFVTPMGPRNRLPLGLKTTNAKTKAFQTPAPVVVEGGKEKTNQRSASARRPKPVVSHSHSVKVEIHEDANTSEEEDIEYMPPKPVEMPDYPEDFPHDLEFPQFENGNLMRGWYATYYDPLGQDGLSAEEQRLKKKKADEDFDREMERAIEEMPLYGYNVPEFPGDETVVAARQRKESEAGQKELHVGRAVRSGGAERKPTATISRRAATLLSQSISTEAKAKATVANAKAKPRAPLFRPKAVPAAAARPGPSHASGGAAASRTTVGYGKGRAVASSMQVAKRKPADSKVEKTKPVVSKLPPLYTTEEWERMMKRATVGGEVDEEDVEPALRGLDLSVVLRDEQSDEDFVL